MRADRDDSFYMRSALALAERGWGRVAPNPMVGAIVVKDGAVVGEGYHAEWGASHAEVAALEAAGSMAHGATLYVTLEPCHHTGKTGPCSRAILEAGIARLVYASADPNPEAGGGAAWLRDHGVSLVSDVCAQEALDLNAIHFKAERFGQPFVALKYAMSLDARLAESPGATTRVSGGVAIHEAHRLRAGHDAVMVGIGTVEADDPLLTVREWEGVRKPPVRVVLDSKLRVPVRSNLVQTASEIPVIVFAAEGADADRVAELRGRAVEVELIAPSVDGDRLDLYQVLARLWERGIRSVLCEGGGRLGSALHSAGLVDRIYAFITPLFFGDAGVAAFQGGRGRAARNWRIIRRDALNETTLLVLSPEPAAGGEDV